MGSIQAAVVVVAAAVHSTDQAAEHKGQQPVELAVDHTVSVGRVSIGQYHIQEQQE